MRRSSLLILASLLLAGCAVTNSLTRPDVRATDARVVLMPIDVVVSEMTVGGALEPNAEWTDSALRLLRRGIEQKLGGRQLVEYAEPGDTQAAETELQLRKLHEAIATSILIHRLGAVPLPTVKDQFDWSVGAEARVLGERLGVDYALFVFARDGYQSAGRIATGILLAAVTGFAPPAPQQTGFASLVDLRTGDVVWFNQLALGPTTDDIRTESGAGRVGANLLAGCPL